MTKISKADYSALMLSLPKEEQNQTGHDYRGHYVDPEDSKAFQSDEEVDSFIQSVISEFFN